MFDPNVSRTFGRGDRGSHGAVSKLMAISFTPRCLCLSEETLKAVSPIFLLSVPEEVKDPT